MTEQIRPLAKYKSNGEYVGLTDPPSLYTETTSTYSRALFQYTKPVYKASMYKSNLPIYGQSQTPIPVYHSKPSYTRILESQPSVTVTSFQIVERVERRIEFKRITYNPKE